MKYYQWHLQPQNNKALKSAYLVERSVLDTKLSNYANSTSILFDTNPVPSDKLTSAVLVSTEESPNEIYAYYTDEEQTSLVFAPKDENIVIYAPVNCYQLFDNLTVITQIDFNNFDTSNVTNMSYMFDNCKKLESLNLSNFNTSNVTDMNHMFASCWRINPLDVSSFDTSNVTDMSYMFYSCDYLTSLNVSSFNTSKVTDMSNMFYLYVPSYYGTSELTNISGLLNWDTSNVTDMSNMFRDCEKLTTLDVSSFNTSKVTDMRSMFDSCESLTSLDVSNFNTSNVTDMRNMFNNCTNIQGNLF